MADAHEASLTGTQSTWTGEASDAYHASMDKLTDELRSLAATMDGTAAIVGVSGTLVLMLRDQVRDWIASFVADLIEHALIAVASAAFTLGGSVAVFIGETIMRAATLGTKIATKLSKLLAAWRRWYPNGQLQSHTEFDDHGRLLHRQRWNEDGSPAD